MSHGDKKGYFSPFGLYYILIFFLFSFLYVNSAQCSHIVKERERKYFRAKCEIQGLRFCQGFLGWYQKPMLFMLSLRAGCKTSHHHSASNIFVPEELMKPRAHRTMADLPGFLLKNTTGVMSPLGFRFRNLRAVNIRS